MDAFKVPKKVNRHVLKALSFLSSDNADSDVPTSMILNQVKYQMRNLLPVPNIDMVIRKSLKNLSDIGLIEKTAAGRFAIGRSYVPPTAPKPKTVNRSIFKPSGTRKRSVSQLNPNFKGTRLNSEESLSGDEYDRLRKRMRTNNKKLNYTGQSTELPKARNFRFKRIALVDKLTSPSSQYMRPYATESGSDKSLEMAVFTGPTMGSNTDLNLANISPTQPLGTNEIPCEDQGNHLKQSPNESPLKVVELFKSTHNSHHSVEAAVTNSNAPTNSPSTGQPSMTCLAFSILPTNEKSKTSKCKTISNSTQAQPSKTSIADSNVSSNEKSKTSDSASKFKTISNSTPGRSSKTSVVDSNVSRNENLKTSASALKLKNFSFTN